ncbi:MAG: O-antigen polymerase [Ilyomonas sp.]
MIEIIFIILLSASLFAFTYSLNTDVFFPPALYNLLWTFLYVFYALFIIGKSSDYYFVSWKTLLIFLSGQTLFSAGSLFAVKRKALDFQERQRNTPEVLYSLDKILFIILLVLFPLYLYKIINLVNNSDVPGQFLIVLRYEFSIEQADIGWIKYTNSLAFFTFAVAVYKFNFTQQKPKDLWGKLYKYSLYTLVIAYSLLSAGRTYILFVFCIYLGSRIIKRNIRFKDYALMFLFALIVYSVFSVLLQKGGDTDQTFTENAGSIFNILSSYILAGFYCFNYVITGSFHLDYGENTFRFFIAIAHSIGITKAEPNNLVMPFITNPIIANTYSVYYPYIKDFSWLGLLFLSVWGYIHSYFYYRAERNFNYFFGYSLLLYPLLMSFFQDQYVTLLSTWLQMIILMLIAQPFFKYRNSTNITLVTISS